MIYNENQNKMKQLSPKLRSKIRAIHKIQYSNNTQRKQPTFMWLLSLFNKMTGVFSRGVVVKYKTTNKLIKMTKGSAGFDLTADIAHPITLLPNSTQLIPTGLVLEVPKGYEAQVRSRSGLALKNQVFVLNGVGTIDSDYRGDVGVILHNISDQEFVIRGGMRIAQLVINKLPTVTFKPISIVTSTTRGVGGFGSTGL